MTLELRNDTITARFSPIGARLAACIVNGVDVAFGPGADELAVTGDLYAGVVCGRHAGRITNASFPLDGKIVQLAPNMGVHQLHGGTDGFHVREWAVAKSDNAITFSMTSPDGDQGFPGTLDVKAVYSLQGNTLALDITATTSKPTVCNITNHAYWNMAGSGSVLDQEMLIPAQHYFPLDDLLLPLGTMAPVENTRWDFRAARAIAEDYDNCFKLDGNRGDIKRALMLSDPKSGRVLDVWTSEACVQMYTAIRWTAETMGHKGPLFHAAALAIEPQNVADAPNHPAFPSSILRPGETYHNRMEWRFS